jgi:hypothetical protein
MNMLSAPFQRTLKGGFELQLYPACQQRIRACFTSRSTAGRASHSVAAPFLPRFWLKFGLKIFQQIPDRGK